MAKNTPEKREARRQRAAEAVKERQAAERRRKTLTIVGVVTAIVVVIGGVFALTRVLDTTGDTPDNVPGVAQDPNASQTDAGEPSSTPGKLDGFAVVVGQDDAPVTVTIYEDFQCPACANFEGQVGEQLLEAIDEGKVRVEFRLLSFLDRASTNDYSSRALNAALVVLDTAGVDAFLSFHADLYANQPAEGGPGFEDDDLIERAVAAGAVEADVRTGIEDKVFEQWIKNATDQMSKDGVTGTPTIRIDGEEADPEELLALLNQ